MEKKQIFVVFRGFTWWQKNKTSVQTTALALWSRAGTCEVDLQRLIDVVRGATTGNVRDYTSSSVESQGTGIRMEHGRATGYVLFWDGKHWNSETEGLQYLFGREREGGQERPLSF